MNATAINTTWISALENPVPSEAENKAAMELQRPANVSPSLPVNLVPTPLATTDALPPFEAIIERLSGMSPEAVEKLLTVYRELKADKAEEAYNAAFAVFQRDCPRIPRTSKVNISSSGIAYNYASVEQIMETIGPVLAANGLSVSFGGTKVDGNTLTATCRCSHVGGHSREASFSVPTETKAGMSPQQKYGAAATYAQRRALSSVLGLWTGDPDTDCVEPAAPSPLLTPEQRKHIDALGTEVNQNWDDLYRWWGIANLAEARQDKYKAAVQFLEQKKQQQTKGTE